MTTVQALALLAVEARNRAEFFEARAGLRDSKKTAPDERKARRVGHAGDAKAYYEAANVLDAAVAEFSGRKSA